MSTDGTGDQVHSGRVAAGFIVLALGVLMLLDRHNPFGVHTMRFFPGLAVMAIGLSQMACGRDRHRHRHGGFNSVWLVIVGAWLIASEANVMGLTFRTSWPALIVAAGLMIVLRELFRERGGEPTTSGGKPEER